MSPYERQIDPLESVDVDYVLGVPGQASPTAEERLEVLYTPPSAQRIGTSSATAATLRDLLGEDLLAASDGEVTEVNDALDPSLPARLSGLRPAGLAGTLTELDPRVGLGLGGAALALCLVPVVNLLAALLAVAALVVGGLALLNRAELSAQGLRLAVATVGLALVAGTGSAISLAAGAGTDGPSAGQIARANGGATAQVLAQDLGLGLGAYSARGLPVTLTNTADSPLSYNVTVEALDAAGRRVTADVAFLGALAPGQSTVVTMFTTADKATAAALAAATFRVVEASSY